MAILTQFWRHDDTPPAVQAIEIEGWLDVLEPYDDAEIRAAWAEYQRSGPRSARGALYKPDAGALYAIIQRDRREAAMRAGAHRRAPSLPQAEPVQMSAERAAEILREVGFEPSLTDEARAAREAPGA